MKDENEFYNKFQKLLKNIKKEKPLIHHITNNVTINDCANITLNWGGLPVMASGPEEVEEMVESASALVLNIGTLNNNQLKAMLKAGKIANKLNIPIVLDPVGTGATSYRTESVKSILDKLNISIIKGNKGEIVTLAGESGSIKGVESIGNYSNIFRPAEKLAEANESIVVVSGEEDIVVTNRKTSIIKKGDPLMGELVGTGCMLSSTLGVFISTIYNINMLDLNISELDIVQTAVNSYGIIGERAAVKSESPARFKIEFMDTIYSLRKEKINLKGISKKSPKSLDRKSER